MKVNPINSGKDYVAYPNKLGLRLSIVELNVRAMP